MKRIFTILLLFIAAFAIAQDYEIPYTEEEYIEHTGFSLLYSEEHEQAVWVAYELTDVEVLNNLFKRTNNFRADSFIATGSASLRDYRASGYDRGHLAPAGDMTWSEEAMSDSFYMSNMSPQLPGFNRGVWKRLEALIRNWAVFNGSIYVVTGPVLTDGPYESIGNNEVSIPRYYYKVILNYSLPDKVILDYSLPELKAIGFILANERSSLDLSEFAVTVDEVEEITGIDFFYLLPDEIEELLESQADFQFWEMIDK